MPKRLIMDVVQVYGYTGSYGNNKRAMRRKSENPPIASGRSRYTRVLFDNSPRNKDLNFSILITYSPKSI